VRRALLLAALALLVAAPLARADGDPASDYLLGQASFVPPDDGVPAAYATQLSSVLTAAKTRGYTIRVALIGTRYDMGSVAVLYKQPKPYARFLGKELYFVYKGRLLVVMPNGLAVSNGGVAVPADQAVVDKLPAPGPNGAALAAAATTAVTKLAAKAGAVFPVPPLGHVSTTSTNRDRLKIGIAGAVLLLAIAAFTLLRRRRA
jgi:MYXO-CTERM domain-containing protein